MFIRNCQKLFLLFLLLSYSAVSETTNVNVIDIEDVWSGHPVNFSLLTHPPKQFAAFYNADRQMTVVSRNLDETTWNRVELPEAVYWDSHNYITMIVDEDGYIHLSGNMHVDPLVYFRTREPLDITTFERAPMVGELENRTTYPQFMRGPDNILLFRYRDGSSGSGNEIFNQYDLETQTWSRLLDQPLVDGEGKQNAYFFGPLTGPDGYYHLCWVWRVTYHAETNNNPSYARSRDLIHWENSRGEALTLPITFDTSDIVDPIPPEGGVINGNVRLGFDLEDRPVVTYHKFDEDGNTQLYNTRLEDGSWVVYQASDWDYRWWFHGGGSLNFEIRINPVRREGNILTQTWTHSQYGTQRWRLDPETLHFAEQLELIPDNIPAKLREVRSDFPGMRVNFQNDSGRAEKAGVQYVLRWETLDSHRDRPREEPHPEPSQLQLYRIGP